MNNLTHLRPTSPEVFGCLHVPIHAIHEERKLHQSDKNITIHQFNGIIAQDGWYFPLVRRLISLTIPNISSTTIQILSGTIFISQYLSNQTLELNTLLG